MLKKIIKCLIIIYFFFLTAIFFAWAVFHIMNGGQRFNSKTANAIIEFAQFPSKVFHWTNWRADERIIDDTSFPNGIHYYSDTANVPLGYLLTSYVDDRKDINIQLIDVKKNTEIKKWHIIADSILRKTNSPILDKKNLRIIHPILLKDSSIIFNTSASLFKINAQSKIEWCNNIIFHHSIEYANDTSLWACSRIINKQPFYITEKDSLANDAITLVNAANGKIIFQKTVYNILKENNYSYLLGIGLYQPDAIHLNEIYPAKTNSKYWQIGDLLISMRHRSTVFLYRPSTNKILWLKTGPWNNQHSCKFMDSTHIMVLGNDVISSGFNNSQNTLLNNRNHLYVYNFETNTVDTPYYKMLDKLDPKTLTEGRISVLPNGDIFMEETNNGKIYIFDKDKLKLTYCHRVDNKHIQMQNWSRFIPAKK